MTTVEGCVAIVFVVSRHAADAGKVTSKVIHAGHVVRSLKIQTIVQRKFKDMKGVKLRIIVTVWGSEGLPRP